MKRWLITGTLTACSWLLAHGQNAVNIVHNYTIAQGWPDAGGGSGRSVLECNTGYVVIGHQVATGGLTKDFIFSFDPVGSSLGDLELNALSPSNQNFGYIDPVEKDVFGVIGAMSSFDGGNDSTSQVDLVRVSAAGDPLWQVSVLDTCPCGVKQMRMGTEGKTLMAGYYGLQGMLLIGDTLGGVDTLKVYPNTYQALGVRPLDIGGCCLSGCQATGIDNSVWVMRLDSVGNQMWRHDLGGSRFASKNVSAIQTQDGGIVATCSYMPLPGSPTDPQWNYFRKWDIDGNLVWTKQYNEASHSTSYDLEELGDGRLVASGSESYHYGTLLQLEPDGDLMWMRRYAYYQGNGSYHTPYDVEPTSDGGFVMTGVAQQGPSDSLPGLQMVWLLKVDSMGCLVPGCGNIGVEEMALGLENALTVYPNPASGAVTVEATLPNDLEVRGVLRLIVVDALGRVVKDEVVGKTFTTTELDLSGSPAGVYHLHLRDDNRWLSGTTVVVE